MFRAILKYANHPSTIAIKDVNNTSMFSFSNTFVADVKKEIWKLDPRKVTQNTDIPVAILKQNSNVFGNYICDFFSECVDKGVFPYILKNANITPGFKKGFRVSKDNDRPASRLLLKPVPRPCTRTQKNLDHKKPGPWKTWTSRKMWKTTGCSRNIERPHSIIY